jgi:exonuclease III
MKLFLSFLFFLFFFIQVPHCQNINYKIRTIAFYNVENLFDTINNPDTFDEDFTPSGKNNYTREVYFKKIENIGKVISEIGAEKTKTSPAIIGLAEIENRAVLEDLIHSEKLKNKQYNIIHYDSPDLRGIDVALLYQEKYFSPLSHETFEVKLWEENGNRIYTRDQLLVSGLLGDDLIFILVNHWPSRRGGQLRSNPKREKAAYVTSQIIKKIKLENENAKIFIMGDFNDDPTDISIKNVLKSNNSIKKLRDSTLYNPMENLYKKGLNTLGYRDQINLFDQILMTPDCISLDYQYNSFQYFKVGIFNPSYLITNKGRYKGYPFRSFGNGHFTGGYSDHFPVYVYVIKKE